MGIHKNSRPVIVGLVRLQPSVGKFGFAGGEKA